MLMTIKNLYTILVLIILLALILGGYSGFRGCIRGNGAGKNLTPLKSNQVAVTRKTVRLKDKEVIISRGTEMLLEAGEDNQIRIVSMPGVWPIIVYLPQLGLSLTNKLEPLLGVQLLRSEAIQLGAALNITPSYVSISLERDLSGNLSNSVLGLQYGLDSQGYTKWALKFALYF